jgi:tetratricopeptide (TPR) repeat protein
MELYDFEAADARASEALARDPSSVRALLIRGDAAFMRFQSEAASGSPADRVKEMWHEAMAIYEQASGIDPSATGPYLGMATLYEADKKWDEASGALMKALVLDPELLQGYNKLIALFGNTEGREKLVSLLKDLLAAITEKFPGDEERKATPFYYAGFAHFLNFDYEASIEAYSASLKSNAAYRTGATYYIARSRFALNEYENAARDFFRILSSDPEGFQFYLTNDPAKENVCIALSFLSNHCYEKGNMSMARDLLAGVLMVENGNPVYYNNYAFLCRETNKYEDAYEAYREALSLDPNNPSILNDTALILHYHLHRDLKYAEELYGRAIDEANRILEDETANGSTKDDARTALRDAQNNLRLLKRGILRERSGPSRRGG